MTDTLDRQTIINLIRTLSAQIAEEERRRSDIMRSADYKAAEEDLELVDATMRSLAEDGNEIRLRMTEMTAAIPNSKLELFDAKAKLIEIMQLEGVEGYNQNGIIVSGKFSEKKGVNGRLLLETLGGDIDEFVKLSKPTQASIKEYAQEHQEIKKELLGCIKIVSRDLVDVEITIPESENA